MMKKKMVPAAETLYVFSFLVINSRANAFFVEGPTTMIIVVMKIMKIISTARTEVWFSIIQPSNFVISVAAKPFSSVKPAVPLFLCHTVVWRKSLTIVAAVKNNFQIIQNWRKCGKSAPVLADRLYKYTRTSRGVLTEGVRVSYPLPVIFFFVDASASNISVTPDEVLDEMSGKPRKLELVVRFS